MVVGNGERVADAPDEVTLTAYVMRRVREAIISGELSPGQRIRQEAIAEACGTSRLPVREALRQLGNEGLVVLVPNVGARVASFDLDELNEIYEIRERLEPFVVSKSAPLLRDEQIEQLRALTREMEAASERSPLHVWLELDRRFHFLTFEGASQPRMMALIEGLWNRTGQYRHAYTTLPHRLDLAHLEHRLLLDGLERRDPFDSARVLEIHIRRTRLTLISHPEALGKG